MVQISRYIKRKLAVLSPTTLFDFRKYYPESWQVFLDHKVKYIYNCIASNLERGIQEGLYREDLDVDVLAKIYVARLEIFADNEVFPFHKYNVTKVYREFIRYHIRGIASPKGVEYLEQLKPEEEMLKNKNADIQ